MITRYCGLPNPEYQILTSRSPLRRSLFARGRSPAVTIAASFVSKIATLTGPVSLAVKEACWARDELEGASSRMAERLSRLMPIGLFSGIQGHILRPHPQVDHNPLAANELRCGKGP